MSRATISKHYARIIALWPKDPLRPEVSFQKALQSRAAKAESLPAQDQARELREVNALYSLLDNRYSKKYPVQPSLLHPTSNPTYYDDLLAELAQAPTRTWFQRWWNRMKGTVRFS